LQGLKPDIDLIGFVGTTEVVPFYKASELGCLSEFFRSLRSRALSKNRVAYAGTEAQVLGWLERLDM